MNEPILMRKKRKKSVLHMQAAYRISLKYLLICLAFGRFCYLLLRGDSTIDSIANTVEDGYPFPTSKAFTSLPPRPRIFRCNKKKESVNRNDYTQTHIIYSGYRYKAEISQISNVFSSIVMLLQQPDKTPPSLPWWENIQVSFPFKRQTLKKLAVVM